MKAFRLNRLFNPKSNRCFDVAIDHGFASAQVAESPPPRPFGAPPKRERPDRPAEAHEAVLVVRSIGDLGDGRAILNLADGSSWVETDAEPITSTVKPGDSVRLEKGVLGGYLLVLPHRSAIRIRRLRTE